MQRNEPRLEKRKEVLAEQRLENYFLRKSWDPDYTYPGLEEDFALSRRKRRERGANDRGVGHG